MVPLAYLVIYLIWGSTFLAIRFAVQSMPPLLMMGIRCTTAGLVLLGTGVLRRDRLARRHWKPGLLAGVLMFTLPYASLGWAEQHIPSGMAALLVATLPLWLVALEWMKGTMPGRRAAFGFALGFGGVVMLVADGLTTAATVAPMAAIVVSELAWAVASVYVQPELPRPLALNAGLPLTIGGSILLMGAAAIGELRTFHAANVSATAWIALVYLIVFGSIVGFSAYMFLLRVEPASSVGTHAFINPVIAVVLGVLLGHEQLTPAIVGATLVIASGVALVIRNTARPAAQPATSGARPLEPPSAARRAYQSSARPRTAGSSS
jgi:drug/metabolite transporter (DMT)-like permease